MIPFRAYSRPTSTTGHDRIAACRRLHDDFYPTQIIMQPAARSNPTLLVCRCFSGVMDNLLYAKTFVWDGKNAYVRLKWSPSFLQEIRVHDHLDNLRSAI